MSEKVQEKLVKTIEVLADRISGETRSDDALRFTQAALNVAYVMQIMFPQKA